MNILKFSAPWCQPCQQLQATLDGTSLGNIQLESFNIDEDDDMLIAAKYKVRSIPTMVFIDDTGNEIARLVGSKTKEEILDTIEGLESIY